eukprot:CAMPEP_0172017494 /NCGR_PEP_ID=MMETSP1041-20130122/11594_1 /TAXON_ID=464988 /ORGANISM="Hemiselmis andersenii, Strain CCMP439" /LENGTH=109 /DNA_ID=CAMNT_0012672527 /DNA_START=55 /DNA_END=384 /DNA_ORIENTATION=+
MPLEVMDAMEMIRRATSLRGCSDIPSAPPPEETSGSTRPPSPSSSSLSSSSTASGGSTGPEPQWRPGATAEDEDIAAFRSLRFLQHLESRRKSTKGKLHSPFPGEDPHQ